MIRSFRHSGLQKFFLRGKATGIRADHANLLRLILAQLNASVSPQDMNLPGLKFHSLKGSLKGFFAVNVSGNWRVVFRFDGPDAIDFDYLDYH